MRADTPSLSSILPPIGDMARQLQARLEEVRSLSLRLEEERRELARLVAEADALLADARAVYLDPGLNRSWGQRRRRWRDRAAVAAGLVERGESNG